MIQFLEYNIKPQSGLISITTGETRGIKAGILLNPEGVEYHNYAFEKFNPCRVVKCLFRFLRGLHPRLFRFNSFGVHEQLMSIPISTCHGSIYFLSNS
jgi:hypothetical protein